MTPTSLRLDYVSSRELALQSEAWWGTVLGVAGFTRPPKIGARVPTTASMTPALGGTGDLCEVWRLAGRNDLELSAGSRCQGRLQYRHGHDFLFGSITLDEDLSDDTSGAALERTTTAAYEQIFDLLADRPQRHLIRVWNYVPEINREVAGDERYRRFNSARQTAFRSSGRSTVGPVPAACALGSPAGSPICIFFLASRRPPTMIENPRQTSAYHYPPQFGTASPTFSRACLIGDAAGTHLFVSGTASIVGHATLHAGDVTSQTHESLANIAALLNEANRVLGSRRYSLDSLKLKVYVRHAADLADIEGVVAATVRPSTPIVYLQADICREDLLVEIEAVGMSC